MYAGYVSKMMAAEWRRSSCHVCSRGFIVLTKDAHDEWVAQALDLQL